MYLAYFTYNYCEGAFEAKLLGTKLGEAPPRATQKKNLGISHMRGKKSLLSVFIWIVRSIVNYLAPMRTGAGGSSAESASVTYLPVRRVGGGAKSRAAYIVIFIFCFLQCHDKRIKTRLNLHISENIAFPI